MSKLLYFYSNYHGSTVLPHMQRNPYYHTLINQEGSSKLSCKFTVDQVCRCGQNWGVCQKFDEEIEDGGNSKYHQWDGLASDESPWI